MGGDTDLGFRSLLYKEREGNKRKVTRYLKETKKYITNYTHSHICLFTLYTVFVKSNDPHFLSFS